MLETVILDWLYWKEYFLYWTQIINLGKSKLIHAIYQQNKIYVYRVHHFIFFKHSVSIPDHSQKVKNQEVNKFLRIPSISHHCSNKW